MMEQTVKFRAKMSGDGECFTFVVTEEEFLRLTGENPDKIHDRDYFTEGLYSVYPSHVFPDTDGFLEIEISWKEVE
jgi:hypothetical protein